MNTTQMQFSLNGGASKTKFLSVTKMKKVICILALLFASIISQAQVVDFTLSLDGPQAGTPSTGTGSGTGTLDTGSLALTLNGTFSGLGTAANAAHIHGPAAPGQPAGILVGINFTAATSGNFSFSGNVDSTTSTAIQNGLAYVNIHTVDFPGGEIRGQLTIVPEPETYAMAMATGLLGFCVFRRRRPQAA